MAKNRKLRLKPGGYSHKNLIGTGQQIVDNARERILTLRDELKGDIKAGKDLKWSDEHLMLLMDLNEDLRELEQTFVTMQTIIEEGDESEGAENNKNILSMPKKDEKIS